MARLQGKVAVITGAGAGIGRAASERFAAEGARVVVADRDEDAGHESVARIEAAGGTATFVACDVTDADSAETAIGVAIATFGQLDILYNNAGGSTSSDGPVHEIDIAEWRRATDVDLYGTFLMSRFAVRSMLERGGAIVNTSSAAALVGIWPGGRSAYSAAKGGILSLTRAMAASYREPGIRVNAIAPGGIATQRIVEAFAQRGRSIPEDEGGSVPSIGRPEDIANAALYLASDEARYVTGTVLAVDGGSTSTRQLS
jgi:NAD(P)-dependent dehydrogenase (short-subunit alcohol dehydrogenase family)